jgi:exodeoxyribonuclease V alpha subunit
MPDKIIGHIHRVTYRNPQNDYCVVKVKLAVEAQKMLFDREIDPDKTITVTGELSMLREDDQVSITGEWKTHSKYGTFLEATQVEVHPPTSLEGLKKFLASPHFKGIGPALAEALVEKFGDELPDVIEKQPAKLRRVKGITEVKADVLKESWANTKRVRAEMIDLQAIGLTANLAQKVISHYSSNAVEIVKNNPYQLAQDIWGVGFNKADDIAQKLGLGNNHPFRVRSGIQFALSNALDDGHVYLPMDDLLNKAQELLKVELLDVRRELEFLLGNGDILVDQRVSPQAVYLKQIAKTESEVSERLTDLSRASIEESRLTVLKDIDLEKAVKDIETDRQISLAPEQRAAIKIALAKPLSVLTGGPGTGKSTAINTLVRIANNYGLRVALTAPTGRAAKRLSEVTGQAATTLHRLLKIKPFEDPTYHAGNPLPFDLVVVDESSMLDLQLTHYLLQALAHGTHLLLVGDADQLPSVQAGNILADLISSEKFPVTALRTIFRQAQGSAIIENAHRIRDGEFPKVLPHPTDFYLFPADDLEQARQEIVSLVTDRIPSQFGYQPLKDIQVLAPLYKTLAGVAQLNNDIQDRLNPNRRGRFEIKFGNQVFRENDRVMQLRNNYDKDVFNGEVGIIQSIQKVDGETRILIRFDDRVVDYEFDELRELTLAYAVSVHKSQGSEYPVVVMPILTSHYIMLQRNLLYTAVTRAKKLVVLVGSKRAIFIALNNDKPQLRYSGLVERLNNLRD